MDLWSALKVIARRWPIVVAALLVTAVTANVAVGKVDPEYEAKGSIVLLGPSTVVEGGSVVDVNPYLRLFGAERILANTLVSVMQGPAFAQKLAQAGAGGPFEASLAAEAAIINIVTRDPDPDATLKRLDTIVDLMKKELAERQRAAGAPPDTWVAADVLTLDDRPATLMGSRVRVLVAVVALGLAIAVSLAFLAESVAQRPRRRAVREGLRDHAPVRGGRVAIAGVHSLRAEDAEARSDADGRKALPSAGRDLSAQHHQG